MSQDSRETVPDEPFDQKNLALDYYVKWQKIARSTNRINRTSASEAIKAAYEALGAQKPEILFFDSSSAAMDMLKKNPEILKEDEHWDWHRRIQIQLIIRPDNWAIKLKSFRRVPVHINSLTEAARWSSMQ